MKKPRSITIATHFQRQSYAMVCCLHLLSMRALAELLRERSIPIPKDKDIMVDRLANHLAEHQSPIQIRIG